MDGMCQLNDGWILSPAAAQPTSPQRTHPSQPMLRDCHAQLSFDDTVEAMRRVQDVLASGKPSVALKEVRAFCQL